MPQVLRPYQQEATECVMDALAEGLTRVLYTQATGSGKTTVMAELSRRFLFRDWRVLVLAHRVELIGQAYNRIQDHCSLTDFEIGTEIGDYSASANCKVIVGSVMTCYKPKRLPTGWTPNVLITDESHHSTADTYQQIADRFGVMDGQCIHIGTTATAKRTDKQSLYAVNIDGTQVMLERKGGKKTPAQPEESIFQKHVYDYSVLDGIDDGYLVPIRGFSVTTDTDLNGIAVTAGDFQRGALEKRVDNMRRTQDAINAWKEVGAHRPTIVFCAGVEHAHHAAQLWQQAGYKAEAIDGKTDTWTRGKTFNDFKEGRLQVLCNMGVYTEGADLPTCSCIVMLRPTRSWTLYNQMAGRSSRVLPGIVDDPRLTTQQSRRDAIAASAKPDSIIIDMVDLYDKCGSLCTIPSIADLPIKMDMEGHTISEGSKLMKDMDDVKDRAIGDCEAKYSSYKVRLQEIRLMTDSGARTEEEWKSFDGGYRYFGTSPGYCAVLHRDNGTYRLEVTGPNNVKLLNKTGKPDHDMKAYLDKAEEYARAAIDAHKASCPKPSLGTLAWMREKTPGWLRMMKRKNFHDATIDAMTKKQVVTIATKLADEHFGRK